MKKSEAHRRSLLKRAALGGTGLLIATAGGVVYRAWDQGALGSIYDGPAFEPWKEFKNERHQGAAGIGVGGNTGCKSTQHAALAV